MMDEAKMRIVFSNILTNALKHAPDNSLIEARALRDDEEITILIADQGPGVSETDLPRIFDRFYRTEKARTIGSSGLGLGLSIVQKIIELHAGRVRAYNSPQKGLTIEIVIPTNF